MPHTQTLDKLYLEWSQFTRARNSREVALVGALHNMVAIWRSRSQDEAELLAISEAESALLKSEVGAE